MKLAVSLVALVTFCPAATAQCNLDACTVPDTVGGCLAQDLCTIDGDYCVCDMPVYCPDTCEFQNDGECDVPTHCAYGTDTNDCTTSMNVCPFTNDNECDEPHVCASGTDSNDCFDVAMGFGCACPWENDGECDDGAVGDHMCAPGSDCSDCACAPAPSTSSSKRYAVAVTLLVAQFMLVLGIEFAQ